MGAFRNNVTAKPALSQCLLGSTDYDPTVFKVVSGSARLELCAADRVRSWKENCLEGVGCCVWRSRAAPEPDHAAVGVLGARMSA